MKRSQWTPERRAQQAVIARGIAAKRGPWTKEQRIRISETAVKNDGKIQLSHDT
jgi:hypothetical protein